MTVTSLRLPEPPRPDAEERLAFAEQLLACEGPEACARACLEWLGAHGGIEQGLCAAIDLHSGPGHLRGLAQLGLPEGNARAFSLDATREDHPLVAALLADGPVPVDGAHVPIPMGQAPFVALPLGRRGERAVGLLLVRGPEPLSPRVAWAARLTGERLSGLHAHRALAEERVLRERAVLAGLVAALPVPVMLYDVEGRRVLGNARADWLLTAHADDASRRARAASLNQTRLGNLLRKARPGPGAPAEVTLADPAEGADLRFELTTLEVEGADGRPGTLVLLREGGRAEIQGESAEKLRAARAEAWSERHRMDVILDSVADPVLVSGPGGEVVLMNAPAERLFVVPPGGGPDAERRVRVNDAYFASFVDHLVCASGLLRWRGELSLEDPASGVPVPVEAMAGKVLTESGELSTIVTILHDRTEARERAQLYEQLVRASDELEAKVRAATAELAAQNELLRRQALALEQASAAKSQFLANMSHEFRTPLNAILGYTQMLLQGVNGELTPPQKKNLTRIDSNGRHLLAVINDILDITRIEAGRMPLHLSRFAVPELLDEVLAELGAIVQRSGLDVAREAPEGLPQLESDRQKVKQILVNFLSNALKFTHQGQIRVRASYAEPAFTLSVTDTGIGIAEKDQQQVFEDFHQVDSSVTRAYGGTGLGLAICRRLAEMLDGHISLRSTPGQGSTFTLHLPSTPRRA